MLVCELTLNSDWFRKSNHSPGLRRQFRYLELEHVPYANRGAVEVEIREGMCEDPASGKQAAQKSSCGLPDRMLGIFSRA